MYVKVEVICYGIVVLNSNDGHHAVDNISIYILMDNMYLDTLSPAYYSTPSDEQSSCMFLLIA